ncbi:hypothetical protein ACIA5C_39500 [Actinoplanes sp. NPDC051343]|uniref:hypothetical protein n=1 Tax=Actinoplanes sp. NPDC051343 TaxID=3363906 RepID=UPI0037887B62
MEPELLELLKDAKEEAPPPRYGVEEAVAAGRRLRRQHRAGWAIAAAAAVAAAIGVPAIVTHPAAPDPRPVVGETPPATGPGTLNFTFRGYVAAGFRVDDPAEADLGSDTAVVRALNASTDAATLRVFHPGTDPSAHFRDRSTTAADPIDGRPAFYSGTDLWWQYATGRYAVLTARNSAMNREQMYQVAAAFRLGATRPVLIGFATERLPANYMLVEAYGTPSGPGHDATSGATFLLASAAKAMAAQPDRVGDNSILGFRLDLARWTPSYPHLNQRGVTCPPAGGSAALTCYRLVDLGRDGEYVLSATWTDYSTGPLSAALTSTRLAALYDLTTWWEAGRAFPASARVPG